MKKPSTDFQPKVARRANAAQLQPQLAAQQIAIVDNRSTAIRQRKIQEASQKFSQQTVQLKSSPVQALLAKSGASVIQRVIHKGGHKSKAIGLKASDFYKNLPSDDYRQWAVILHGDEDTDYTQKEAVAEIEDRIKKNLPIPAVDGQEDPQMRMLIEKHQTGHSRKQDRQVKGMHGLYELGTQQEKDQMIAFLNGPANAKGFTDSVRQGELNETLLTSDTKDAALRSLNAVPGILPSATIDSSGVNTYWTDYQSDTSYQTKYFTFRNTTTDDDGNEIQDTHINGSTYREDSDGKKHLTVGSTSDKYHFGPKKSLFTNLRNSTRLTSFARRNAKLHRKMLAKREDIIAIKAEDRAEQMYRTTNGTILYLNNEDDLDIFAEHVQIHTEKVNTDLDRQAKRLRSDGNESESDLSDYEHEMELDVDTDDEAEVRIKKRKKSNKHKKQKVAHTS